MPIHIKRKIYKFWLKLNKSFERSDFIPQVPITETQELALKIFEKSIVKNDTELLMAPLSLTYYVHTKDIFIIMDRGELRIINGRYEYHITINDKIFERLSDKFKRVMENKRKKMEQEMVSKTKRSLENILQDLL
jgi:hypothetical protein